MIWVMGLGFIFLNPKPIHPICNAFWIPSQAKEKYLLLHKWFVVEANVLTHLSTILNVPTIT
jgi:hypothetical protein